LIGILTFFLVIQIGLYDNIDLLYWDDSVSDQVTEIYQKYLPKLNIFAYIAIVTSFGSQLSTIFFSIWLPILQVLWLLACLIASIFILRDMYSELEVIYTTTPELEVSSAAPILVGLALLVAAFLYPHIGYILEVKRGILSRETYPREERCCCCSKR
jgi:hypothetical protein